MRLLEVCAKYQNLMCWLLLLKSINVFKISFRNTIRVSNALDPDEALHFVGHDLGPLTACKGYQKIILSLAEARSLNCEILVTVFHFCFDVNQPNNEIIITNCLVHTVIQKSSRI